MHVELSKFRVKEGKSERVDEWLQFLNNNMKDVLVTLENEKMYVETIFRERTGVDEFLYWFSIQGEGGQTVEQSEHWIDKRHLEYWDECIDETFRAVDVQADVVMIPNKVAQSMM